MPDRWLKIAVASAKQCGRAVVPQVHPQAPYDRFIDADRSRLRILLVEPSADSATGEPRTLRSLARRPAPESAVLAVGPEDGLTSVELARAERARALKAARGALVL